MFIVSHFPYCPYCLSPDFFFHSLSPFFSMWRIVSHEEIDGYSWLSSLNIRSDTVMNLFVEAISHYGVPSTVRCDHGEETMPFVVWGSKQGSALRGRAPITNWDTVSDVWRIHISEEQSWKIKSWTPGLFTLFTYSTKDKTWPHQWMEPPPTEECQGRHHFGSLCKVVRHDSCNMTLVSKVYLERMCSQFQWKIWGQLGQWNSKLERCSIQKVNNKQHLSCFHPLYVK